MAYNAVPTVATGDLWTASSQNTYLRDNMAALWPYTAQGDMAVATSGTSLKRVPKGINGSLLGVMGGEPQFKAFRQFIPFGMSGNISTYTSNTSFIDIMGSIKTLTLPYPAELFLWLNGTISATGADTLRYKILVGTIASPEAVEVLPTGQTRQTLLMFDVYAPAGEVTIKAQYRSVGGTNVWIMDGRL